MKIPGFLFDNDGVLIDSQQQHWLAWQAISQEYGLNIEYANFLEGFGKRNETFLKNLSPSSQEEERIKWADRKEEVFRSQARGRVALLPGIETFLEELKKQDFARIIASSGTVENLKMFLSSTILGQYFDEFVSAEQVPYGKPAPDIFQEAASRLGLMPEECIVLEDSPAGLEAGRRAGCFVVALATTHDKNTLINYDMIFDSPKQLRLNKILQAFKEWKPLGF